jgi:hypothetical protein
MTTSHAIWPTSAAGITAEWLTAALDERHPALS